jgi:hypothetical protein
MLRWLLSWLFPLWALLPRARALGAVSFVEVLGVGWQCSVRPPHAGPDHRRARGVNCWTAQGPTLGSSLRAALAETTKSADHEGSSFAPRLGGAEFDPDEYN